MNVDGKFSVASDPVGLAERRVGIGHNGGPPLDEPGRPWGAGGPVVYRCWLEAQRRAWRDVPFDTVRRRAARAAQLGLTYREYTLEILERGRYLSAADSERIAEIKAKRGSSDW
ncbi:MAG: hypothetical protein R3F55_15550 [Alphaproteobacteria bacterium]